MSRPPVVASIGQRLVRAYPSSWRARYGAELLALLDDRPPDWRDAIDLARGALDAHLHPSVPSRFVAWAALLAGAMWLVVGLGVVVEPAAPDWPGYLSWTLVPAVIGAAAGLATSLGLALRLGRSARRFTRVAVATAALGQAALSAALFVAALGGPYGALTGAAGSLAGFGLVLQGVASVRAGRGAEGVGLTVIGGALLVPAPASWLVVGGTWTVLGAWLTIDWSGRRSEPLGPAAAA